MRWMIYLVVLMPCVSSGKSLEKTLLEKEYLTRMDSFYDPNFDYSKFPGRVSDKNRSMSILKIQSENKNIRFFRAGDGLTFEAAQSDQAGECKGLVRRVEKNYFVLYVQNLADCWPKEDYFRSGTRLNFISPRLAERVREAGMYRRVLIKRKRDFLHQLSEVNHFVWSYKEKKLQMASQFDKQILSLEQEKQKALDSLREKKKEYLELQEKLSQRLDRLDHDLDFHRIDKADYMADRWDHDQDLGHPVAPRPQEVKNTVDL